MYKTFGSADVMLGSNAIYEKTRDVKRYKRKKKEQKHHATCAVAFHDERAKQNIEKFLV